MTEDKCCLLGYPNFTVGNQPENRRLETFPANTDPVNVPVSRDSSVAWEDGWTSDSCDSSSSVERY
jgi:hypothetical protein